jgi:hypothetical protein
MAQFEEFKANLKNVMNELEATPGKANKTKLAIKIYEMFDCQEGKKLLTDYPQFKTAFLLKLEELYNDVPNAFEPFVLKYIPHILKNTPIASRTRSKLAY